MTSDNKYLWDGLNISEKRIADGTVVLQPYYGQGFVDYDGVNLYYTKDMVSVRELTDATQAIRARYDYDPFDRMTKISGDRDSAFTYTGHFWHAQSGLDLTMYRAYDASLGRWISVDPLGEDAVIPEATTEENNLYKFAFNSPINWFDPDGLWPQSVINQVINTAQQYGLNVSAQTATSFLNEASWGQIWDLKNPKISPKDKFLIVCDIVDKMHNDPSLPVAVQQQINSQYSAFKKKCDCARAGK